MKKIICNAKDCANKNVIYFMAIEEDFALCGSCKARLDAVTMTDAEIATTFDYDYNAPSMLGQ